MSISVNLDDDQSQKIEELASRLNVAPNDLAKAVIDDLLANSDADFEDVAQNVLNKNKELYRRLG